MFDLLSSSERRTHRRAHAAQALALQAGPAPTNYFTPNVAEIPANRTWVSSSQRVSGRTFFSPIRIRPFSKLKEAEAHRNQRTGERRKVGAGFVQEITVCRTPGRAERTFRREGITVIHIARALKAGLSRGERRRNSGHASRPVEHSGDEGQHEKQG
jgi:hypothetical protein